MKSKYTLALVGLTCMSMPAYGQTLDPVVVEGMFEGEMMPTPSMNAITAEDIMNTPVHDGGDLLRSVAGVTAGRMGGHALEPVIRGQQQNQITIVNDGALQYGGCPNRMDTPTAFVPVESYDNVVVTKGYQTVTNGAGASGGHVAFNREDPTFEEGQTYKVNAGAEYESNSNTKGGFADVAVGDNTASLRAITSWKNAGNYEDGKGDTVLSGYKSRSASVDGSWQVADNFKLGAGVEIVEVEDALFEGAMMDSPDTESNVYKLTSSYKPDQSTIKKIDANVFYSTVNHLMDNYSLRERVAGFMKTTSDSDTYGGRVAATLDADNGEVVAGIDFTANNREADRFSGAAVLAVDTLQSLLWPDVTIGQVGLFAEHTHVLDAATTLTVGGRYDHITSEAGAATQDGSGGISPNDLYQQYYGIVAEDKTEDNFGGLVRLEKELTNNKKVHVSLSRSVRTADATERYIAASSPMPSMRWIGNPNLRPEKHHQLEVGVEKSSEKWSATASAYVNKVKDYIYKDAATAEDGVLLADGATIYHNVDALLAGVEVAGDYVLNDKWKINADATYTYGSEDDTGSALAQIAPLSGQTTATYHEHDWQVSSRLRWATTQIRVDTDSNRDVGETSGYGVFDLFASVKPTVLKGVAVKFGVLNVLDHTYANHLNRATSFDPTEVQVNEPGRSFFIKLHGKF